MAWYGCFSAKLWQRRRRGTWSEVNIPRHGQDGGRSKDSSRMPHGSRCVGLRSESARKKWLRGGWWLKLHCVAAFNEQSAKAILRKSQPSRTGPLRDDCLARNGSPVSWRRHSGSTSSRRANRDSCVAERLAFKILSLGFLVLLDSAARLSSLSSVSVGKVNSAAARFSRRCSTDDVPGDQQISGRTLQQPC